MPSCRISLGGIHRNQQAGISAGHGPNNQNKNSWLSYYISFLAGSFGISIWHVKQKHTQTYGPSHFLVAVFEGKEVRRERDSTARVYSCDSPVPYFGQKVAMGIAAPRPGTSDGSQGSGGVFLRGVIGWVFRWCPCTLFGGGFPY